MSRKKPQQRQHSAQSSVQPSYDAETLSWFKKHAITLDEDGLPQMTKATPALLELSRIVQSAGSRADVQQRIPSAPKYLWPDAVGKGVTRNAWGEPLTDRHLRQYGRKSPVAVTARAACVSQVSSGCRLIRSNQIESQGSQVGLKVVHVGWDTNEPTPKGFDRYIRIAEKLLATPFEGDSFSPCVPSLQMLVQGLYGDIFDLNRGVLEPIRSNGQIIGVRPADGGIIIPAWDTVRRWTGFRGTTVMAGHDVSTPGMDLATRKALVSEDIRNQMTTRGLKDPGIDLTDSSLEWVIYRDGIIDGGFRRGELIVLPMQTSTDIEYAGHPPSYLQQGMEFAAMSWTIHDFHGRKFTDAAWNSMAIAIIGEGYDDTGFNEFLNNFRVAGKGYQRAGKPFVTRLQEGGDIKTIDLRPPTTDAEFVKLQEIIEAKFCAILRRHPEIINGRIASSGGSSLNSPSEDMRIQVAKEEGQVTDMTHVATYLSHFVRMAVHPDLRVVPVFPSADRKAVVELLNLEIQNFKTPNEALAQIGDTPKGFFLKTEDYNKASDEDKKRYLENPYNYPTNPNFLKTLQFTMSLNKGSEDAQKPPPELGPDGKPLPQAPNPMTTAHLPGMGLNGSTGTQDAKVGEEAESKVLPGSGKAPATVGPAKAQVAKAPGEAPQPGGTSGPSGSSGPSDPSALKRPDFAALRALAQRKVSA